MTEPSAEPFRPAYVFLDFDGVIMDSMSLKLDSYCYAFEGMGFSREAIRKLQLASAGLSRFKTVPLMYQALSGRPMSEADAQAALERFNAHDDASRDKMILKRGAREFLEAARGRMPLAIVTGTPQEVIDKTVAHFRLGGYFAQVCGSPRGKTEHLLRVLAEEKLLGASCLFVGDAIKDQKAAREAGIPFVGLNNGDDAFREDYLAAEIQSLDELIPWLNA
jgi:phosphoglycolate phosphatase-like HAD superfamily hydrolase